MNVEQTETPVVEAAEPVEEQAQPEAPKPGPADDLRLIQHLLINGIFPGNVAPQVVKGFQLLEAMAKRVEEEAKAHEAKH